MRLQALKVLCLVICTLSILLNRSSVNPCACLFVAGASAATACVFSLFESRFCTRLFSLPTFARSRYCSCSHVNTSRYLSYLADL